MRVLGTDLSEVASFAVQHAYLAGVPLLLGLLISLPLGWVALRRRWLYPPVIVGTGLLYTIPSLALFVLLPGILGTQILDPLNVIVAMTLYTIALLTRTVADGLGSVPDHVRQAATAMGYGPLHRFFAVELPMAVPVISAGLRVAAVSNVSMVSVAALIGVSQLGLLFTDGFSRSAMGPIVIGVLACVLLALLFDLLILAVTRALTPWRRAVRA
ncbi:ABC transporter permease subunit [Ornithinimicrobium faecis]|uniref:ABC transporter permease subunit n=1 Tax=Ornithinimicrobium faecis TaxID=2934158 RepID=A0ABY4YUN1_9MICO|nr:ABC transporter permease subunit [Ornithinimicrobium sp. HY1793]USQ80429.1 ABC transporter permease subunit [Ornithinimicrobium sp. HY1793]